MLTVSREPPQIAENYATWIFFSSLSCLSLFLLLPFILDKVSRLCRKYSQLKETRLKNKKTTQLCN